METTKMTHEEIAQYLKINPEELEKMEQSYQMSCMDFKEDFFDYGAKDVNSSELTEISTVLEALIERIVQELLQETIILGMDGKAQPFLCEKPVPVTKEEIMRLPENLRPQLTGRYVQKDIPDNSSEMILLFLKKYMDTGDRQAYACFDRDWTCWIWILFPMQCLERIRIVWNIGCPKSMLRDKIFFRFQKHK